jgi:hypothetical protein
VLRYTNSSLSGGEFETQYVFGIAEVLAVKSQIELLLDFFDERGARADDCDVVHVY